jgi:hypothetical protein
MTVISGFRPGVKLLQFSNIPAIATEMFPITLFYSFTTTGFGLHGPSSSGRIPANTPTRKLPVILIHFNIKNILFFSVFQTASVA